MATINGASYLRVQFDSILSQLHPEEELIISDDNYYIEDITTVRFNLDCWPSSLMTRVVYGDFRVSTI